MTQRLMVLVLSFFLIAATEAADMAEPTGNETLSDALGALDAGRFRYADQIITRLLNVSPKDQNLYYFAARAAFGSGQYSRAKTLIDRYNTFASTGNFPEDAGRLEKAITAALAAFAASEKAAFDYAQKTHTIFAYAAFRDAYPTSQNVDAADFMSFRRAKEVNVEISYRRYLDYWPEGKYRQDAQKSADLAAFREARQQNTPESYRSYLSNYPNGVFWEQASQREEALAFAAAKADGSERAINNFLAVYPRGSFSAEARRTLALAKEKAPQRDLAGRTVRVPSGSYIYRPPASKDVRSVPRVFEISQPFIAMVYEVTFDQWSKCVEDGACTNTNPSDEGWGRKNRPVINVNRQDIDEYTGWLNAKWREAGGVGVWGLPSEVEWAYMARGLNSLVSAPRAAFEKAGQTCPDCDDKAGADATFPVGQFSPNSFGLFDMLGNAAEWTDDCWSEQFAGGGSTDDQCTTGVVRGATNSTVPLVLAAQAREAFDFDVRSKAVGFRLICRP